MNGQKVICPRLMTTLSKHCHLAIEQCNITLIFESFDIAFFFDLIIVHLFFGIIFFMFQWGSNFSGHLFFFY